MQQQQRVLVQADRADGTTQNTEKLYFERRLLVINVLEQFLSNVINKKVF